jgi:RNA polymerase sigma-70 factor (ECF subfamily)
MNTSAAGQPIVPQEPAAIGALLSQFEERLKRMIRLRMNPALRGRVDASDIVQDVYLEVSKRLAEYGQPPAAPLFLWVRTIASEKLIDAHRKHLGANKRDARREISLDMAVVPPPNSALLAAQLLGKIATPSQAAIKAEMRTRVQEVLDSLDELDREVLALRHFEQLSNSEAAQVLGLSESGASSRYVRALKRFKSAIAGMPGFLEG